LPNADILYFGDVARMPYGNKSAETVLEYSREITRYLVGRGATLIVIACNTASAVAAIELRREFKVPILDVITPAASEALPARKIAVLGTRATIGSGAYQKAIAAVDPGTKVFPLACPMFVPLVEEGYAGTPEGRSIVKHTLHPLVAQAIDTVILGCTHYPLLARDIRMSFPKARFIDSSAVAIEVAHCYRGKGSGKMEIVATDITPHFNKFAGAIIGKNIPVKKITLENLACRRISRGGAVRRQAGRKSRI
jgi:glutamate racemase